jgi:hypothetical protein
MLDFSLSEEQIALVEAARRFSKERIIPARPPPTATPSSRARSSKRPGGSG